MGISEDGGPAFPQAGWKHNSETGRYVESIGGGMTLRDWFAGQAIAGATGPAPDGWSLSPYDHARWAYEIADAMIAARDAAK